MESTIPSKIDFGIEGKHALRYSIMYEPEFILMERDYSDELFCRIMYRCAMFI